MWPLPGSGVRATVGRSLRFFLGFPWSSDGRQKAVAEPRPLSMTDRLLAPTFTVGHCEQSRASFKQRELKGFAIVVDSLDLTKCYLKSFCFMTYLLVSRVDSWFY